HVIVAALAQRLSLFRPHADDAVIAPVHPDIAVHGIASRHQIFDDVRPDDPDQGIVLHIGLVDHASFREVEIVNGSHGGSHADDTRVSDGLFGVFDVVAVGG